METKGSPGLSFIFSFSFLFFSCLVFSFLFFSFLSFFLIFSFRYFISSSFFSYHGLDSEMDSPNSMEETTKEASITWPKSGTSNSLT
jgi:hypothetical protein